MDLIITHWALNSYMELRHHHLLTEDDYWTVIRPDVLLLKDSYPSPHEKFNHSKFWSEATLNGERIQNAYKMKWHNIGSGKVQLRLCVVILNKKIYVCNGYVKNDKSDPREMGKLKLKVEKIRENKFIKLGVL
jgi:hypothetical protein